MTTPDTGASQADPAWTTQQQWDAYYASDPAYAAYYQQQYQYPQTGQDAAQYNAYYQQYPQTAPAPATTDPAVSSTTAATAPDPYAQWYQQHGYNSYNYQQYPQHHQQPHYSQYPPAANHQTGHPSYSHYSQYPPQTTTAAPPTNGVAAVQSAVAADASNAAPPWRKKATLQSSSIHQTNIAGATETNIVLVISAFPVPATKPKMMLMTKKSAKAKAPERNDAAPLPPPATAEQAATAMSSDNWPDSLKNYVQIAFSCCPEGKKDALEAELRELIIETHRRGTMTTTDWSELDLPAACTGAKKRSKIVDDKKNSLANRINHVASRPSNVSMPSADELKRREARLKRFQESNKVKKPAPTPPTPSTPNPDVIDWDEYTIVGTSTQLEKQYLRLTSAPDPTTVRPLPILRQTLELLLKKWKDERNYTFICDQFKSMRQDLTVQRIQSEFTVQVYECHARIALEMGDLGEYNQCQTQLKQLYSKGIAGHSMEFLAYRILYMLHTQNRSAINAIMAEINEKQAKDKAVHHALQVRSSIATSNYHRFFLLYKETPNMGTYLIHQFIERERIYALRTMCKTYRPSLEIDYVQRELAFDSMQDILKFLDKLGAKGIVDNRTIDTKIALPGLIESAKKFMKVDINRSAMTV